jgi:hypothetical protein
MTWGLFLAYLGIFGPVAVVFAAIGWAARGWMERGHKRRCPSRYSVTDAEWDAITARIREPGGGK